MGESLERRIVVRVLDADPKWRIEVSETGRGISEEDQRRIFEPYVQIVRGGGGIGCEGECTCTQRVTKVGARCAPSLSQGQEDAMRTLLWTALLSSTLVFGASCKKSTEERHEEASKKVVEEQQDVREAQRDAQKKIAEEQREVGEAQKDQMEASRDLERAKIEYQRSSQERVARIDQKIDRLESKGDAESQKRASELRARLDQVKAEGAEMRSRTSENWTAFKDDMSKRWNDLEKDVDRAL
jgi:hypothetical protein